MKTKILLTLVGILISVNANGRQWVQSESYNTLVTEISITGLNQIHAAGERVFTVSFKSDFNYALYYSDDNGASWNEATSDNTTGSYAVFANVDADTIYSYGADLFGTRFLRKSTDAGATWTVQTADYSNFPLFFIATQFAAINDTLILTSTARSAGILKSVDGGATWNSFISFEDNENNKSIQSVAGYGSHFFLAAGTNGRGIFRSHKDSTSWKKVFSVDEVSGSVHDMEIDSNGRIYVLTNTGIEYSDDNGETWVTKTRENLGIGETGTFSGLELKGTHLVFTVSDATNGSKVYEISSGFETAATDITEGLTDYAQGSLIQFYVANSTTVFAKRFGQNTTLWQNPKSGGPVSNEKEDSPERFELSQNYPNPFNPATNISFNLPEAGVVSLKVYNLLGQEVASIVNGRMNAGFQQVSFDASKLASGTYIYRLVAGTNIQTRKMMLIK